MSDHELDTPVQDPTIEHIPAPKLADVAPNAVVPPAPATEDTPRAQTSLDPIIVPEEEPAPAAPAAAPVTPPPAPKKKKKRVGLIIILVLLLLGLIGGGLAFWFFGMPALQYNEAMEAMNAGNFDYAYQKLSELNSYEDSAVRMQEVRYRQAVELLNNKQYDAAYKYFNEIPLYMDSKDLAKECRYRQAKDLLAKGEFADADVIFTNLDTYKDSADMAKECRYQQALALMTAEDYEGAMAIFTALDTYSESQKQLKLCKYNYIQAHYDRGDVMTYEYLTELKQEDYRDTRSLYQKLYAWHITDICVNSSQDDATTNLPSISKYDPVFVHFTVTGGIPNGETRLRISGTHLNGEAINYTFADPVTDNWVGWYGWSSGVWVDPSAAYGGTIRMAFYDGNNNKLADISIIIDDD